jgi:hypothetical protein
MEKTDSSSSLQVKSTCLAEEMFFHIISIYKVGEMETDGLQSKFFTSYTDLGCLDHYVALVCEQTITERPPLISKVSANSCG